ncbi:MAG: hypothetical protein R6V02_11440 [Candidatus Aminicenantes bacterium]
MDSVSKISGIGRPLDFDYSSNRWAFYLTCAAGPAGAVYRYAETGTVLNSLGWGIGAVFSVFLAWALGRELDPDHNPSAFIGMGISFVLIIFLGLPCLVLMFWLLIAVRILNRTTGLPPKIWDILFFIGLGSWLTYRGYWPAGLFTAAVLLADGLLPQGKRSQFGYASLGAAAAAAAFIFKKELWLQADFSWIPSGAALLSAVLLIPVVLESRNIQSRGDENGRKLNSLRIQAGQVLVAVVWLLFSLGGGISGWIGVIPVWAAGLGAGLFRLYNP